MKNRIPQIHRHSIRSIIIFFSFVFIPFFLISCGPSKIIITPDYNNEELANRNSNDKAKIVNVIDNRSKKEKEVGTAQVGLFNKKVPFLMEKEVSKFVEESINKMIVSEIDDTVILPIQIIIDQFEVYEETGAFSEIGNFDCKLKFIYPITDDSLAVIKTKTHQEYSGMDVTNSLEKLIYKGISSCVDTFFTKYKKHKSTYLVRTLNSFFYSKHNIQEYMEEEDSQKTVKKKNSSNVNLGITYSSGNDIDYGLQFLYQKFDSLGSSLYGGFGYSIQYIKIKDSYKIRDAFFLNYNFRYALRYFILENNSGPYLGGSVRLIFGTEKITDYNGEQTNFFFGPTFGEVIGYSINSKVMFELGSYQIKLFGSDLLSSDIGFSFGILFAL